MIPSIVVAVVMCVVLVVILFLEHRRLRIDRDADRCSLRRLRVDLDGVYRGMSARPEEVVQIVAAVAGAGYYLLCADGRVHDFGDADWFGDPFSDGLALNAPPIGMAVDPLGRGYWVAAADGGVFTYGVEASPEDGGLPFFGSRPERLADRRGVLDAGHAAHA